MSCRFWSGPDTGGGREGAAEGERSPPSPSARQVQQLVGVRECASPLSPGVLSETEVGADERYKVNRLRAKLGV